MRMEMRAVRRRVTRFGCGLDIASCWCTSVSGELPVFKKRFGQLYWTETMERLDRWNFHMKGVAVEFNFVGIH